MNEPYVSFRVYGTPAPGGSKNAFVPTNKQGQPFRRPNGSIIVNVVDDAGKRNKAWKGIVANYSKIAMSRKQIITCACSTEITFYMHRPNSHFGSKGWVPYVKPSAPKYPAVKPDTLKLARSTEDAMTGIVYEDDALSVDLILKKRYCDHTFPQEGCIITVRLMEDQGTLI